MKADVKKFLIQFTFAGIKPGDLVLVGEVIRVVSHSGRHGINAVNVEKDCKHCGRGPCKHERIMSIGYGQQGVMKLKGKS